MRKWRLELKICFSEIKGQKVSNISCPLVYWIFKDFSKNLYVLARWVYEKFFGIVKNLWILRRITKILSSAHEKLQQHIYLCNWN